MRMKMRIETERLIITEFTPDMAEIVHENSLDEDNRRFSEEVFETVEDARETIEYLISQYGRSDGALVYPLITKDTGANIGYVQLAVIDGGAREIGYHIAKRYTRQGYATEAVRAFLPVMAERLGLSEIWGICVKENIASRSVLIKCGFEPVYEGTGLYRGEQREIFRGVWKA